MRRALLTLAAAAAIAIVGCGSSGPAKSSSAAPPAKPARTTPSRVVAIVMENREYGEVIGSSSAPYVNALARRYALATHSYGVTHPSLPNYFALTAGSTLGVTSDCTDCQQSAASIADQLQAAGLSWKAYMGGMPSACFKGANSGRYAKKHDPFMYFHNVADNRAVCSKVVPGGRLLTDARAKRLPSYSFFAPDLCNDTHDCAVGTGDRYLAGIVPTVLKALGPKGFLVLTWDEGNSNAGCCGLASGGHIATVIAGPGVRRGATFATPVTHYSTLRTIEQALRLPLLQKAGDSRTASLDGAFRSPPRLR
jgi:hypothetical protein